MVALSKIDIEGTAVDEAVVVEQAPEVGTGPAFAATSKPEIKIREYMMLDELVLGDG